MGLDARPPLASLLDAVLIAVIEGYGPSVRPREITIRTSVGAEIELHMPDGWKIEELSIPVIEAPECVVEVLLTIYETGHRLTKEGVIDAMQRCNRGRGETPVKGALNQLVAMGWLNNKQGLRNPHKGYGFIWWD